MKNPEFTSFDSIERFDQHVTITEKIHGTNAQVFVGDESCVYAGSRNRWLSPEDDNFGFASYVQEHAVEIAEKLGVGQHFGEWYGSGINGGYGMKERRFVLFHPRFRDLPSLPPRMDLIPVLYEGPFTPSIVDDTMERLKGEGSRLVRGYMHPEGVVVRFNRTGVMMKKVFQQEDVEWVRRKEKPVKDRSEVDAIVAPFWQPHRLEKLLSRSESFGRDYPQSLPELVQAYVGDLQKETDGIGEATWKLVKKNAFPAVKGMMAEMGYSL
jgi:hypothetical protein